MAILALALAAADASPLPVGIFFHGLRQGSAFLISDCDIVTAKHVFPAKVAIGAKGRFLVRGHNVRARVTHLGDAIEPQSRGENRGGDWAVARLDECLGRELGHFRLLGQSLARSPFARRPSHLVGFPVATGARSRTSPCQPWAELPDGSVQLACVARSGQSGGPVYVRDDVGHLVAVAVVGAFSPSGFTFAAGTTEIVAAMRDLEVTNAPNRRPPRAD